MSRDNVLRINTAFVLAGLGALLVFAIEKTTTIKDVGQIKKELVDISATIKAMATDHDAIIRLEGRVAKVEAEQSYRRP